MYLRNHFFQQQVVKKKEKKEEEEEEEEKSSLRMFFSKKDTVYARRFINFKMPEKILNTFESDFLKVQLKLASVEI